MSSQLKEQHQQVESKKDFDADHLFNEHIFKTLGYTGLGLGAGLASSLFFKHKAGMTLLFAGAGAGYGLSNMYSDLNNLQRFKNYSQGQPQTLKREDQLSAKDWESYKPKDLSIESQKQPKYSGSDDDSSDNKKDKSDVKQTELKKPAATAKSSETNKENDKSSRHFGEVRSVEEKLPNHSKDFEKLSKQSDKPSKQADKPKESEKTNKQPEKTKESEKTAKQPEKTKEVQNTTKQPEKAKEVQHTTKQPEKTKESEKTAKQPEKAKESAKEIKQAEKTHTVHSKVEGQNFQDFTPKEHGKPKEGDHPFYKGAERTLKTGRDQYSVSGDGPTRMTEQDMWGNTKSQGFKTSTDPIHDNTAGSQFRGKTSAGSQVNAVLE